ncbi:hypothetical protein [Stappia sp.]|uniref:hypothetical protein n=1 Tax=Stappia sp. TaxID=1870903 RepID=UPI003A99EA1C
MVLLNITNPRTNEHDHEGQESTSQAVAARSCELSNLSRACKVMSYSRQQFHESRSPAERKEIKFMKKIIKFIAIVFSIELLLVLVSNITIGNLLILLYTNILSTDSYSILYENKRIYSLNLFCFSSLFLAIFCYFLLFIARITRINSSCNLPFRGELLLVIWYFVMYSFNFALLYMLEVDDGKLVLNRDFWAAPVAVYGFTATLSWLMACGWLGMVHLVYIGGRKEREEIESYLRNVTFMKNRK